MCVCVCYPQCFSFLWVQVPGTGPKSKEWLEESEADIVLRGRRTRICDAERGLWKMKERGSCGGNKRANRVGCIGWRVFMGGDGSTEVEERPMRMGAFQAIVRGKAVSEDAHDCFKVPLYIGNESDGQAHRDTAAFLLWGVYEETFVFS